MIRIGELYMARAEGQARLCADITLNGKGTTLWFGVEQPWEDCLCRERSDAFVMALLPTAMRGGYDMECATPMSERLHYQLENYLIPTLCSAGELYRPMKIKAPLRAEKVNSRGAVATAFSGGVDSMYTIMTHGAESPYPITHLTNFNLGVFEGADYRKGFRKACANAKAFADEMGLGFVGLDSNISEVLPERYLDVYPFRLLGGAMAMQGFLGGYLLSSSFDLGAFHFDLHTAGSYEYLLTHCAQTESLSVYNSGAQCKRMEKMRAISQWEPARRWLHFCIFGMPGSRNCGKCKKCSRDMSGLYALGTVDRFGAVIDLPALKRTLPSKLGFVLANRDADPLCEDVIRQLEESKVPIPEAAYVFEQQFRRALTNLQEAQK